MRLSRIIVPSERGLAVLISLLILLLFSVVVQDQILEIVSILLSLMLLIDLFSLLAKFRYKCSVDSLNLKEINTWVGERVVTRVKLRDCFKPERIIVSQVISRYEVRVSGVFIDLYFESRFLRSGLFRVKEIKLEHYGIFKMFILRTYVKVDIVYKVYPETLYWLLESLRVIGFLGGGVERGEISAERMREVARYPLVSSSVGEYIWSREYSPGEPVRRIDWRATARSLKLYVKEFGEEGSRGVTLFTDLRCYGEYSCDIITSSLLSTLLYLIRENIPIARVYEIDSRRIISPRDPKYYLAYILSRVFDREIIKIDQAKLYEFIEPLDMLSLRSLLKDLVRELSIETYLEDKDLLKDLEIGLGDFSNTMIISCLVHDTDKIVDLVALLRSRGDRVIVSTVEKPWLDSDDLEDAYRVHISHKLAVRRIKSLGAEVFLLKR
ncbi:MAG: DUF58 domain-containing protein [Sulfolobales archaeon]